MDDQAAQEARAGLFIGITSRVLFEYLQKQVCRINNYEQNGMSIDLAISSILLEMPDKLCMEICYKTRKIALSLTVVGPEYMFNVDGINHIKEKEDDIKRHVGLMLSMAKMMYQKEFVETNVGFIEQFEKELPEINWRELQIDLNRTTLFLEGSEYHIGVNIEIVS